MASRVGAPSMPIATAADAVLDDRDLRHMRDFVSVLSGFERCSSAEATASLRHLLLNAVQLKSSGACGATHERACGARWKQMRHATTRSAGGCLRMTRTSPGKRIQCIGIAATRALASCVVPRVAASFMTQCTAHTVDGVRRSRDCASRMYRYCANPFCGFVIRGARPSHIEHVPSCTRLGLPRSGRSRTGPAAEASTSLPSTRPMRRAAHEAPRERRHLPLHGTWRARRPRAHSRTGGYGGLGGEVLALDDLARRIGHDISARPIRLLKIDCEGCEWEAFVDVAERAPHVLEHVCTLVLEIHVTRSLQMNSTAEPPPTSSASPRSGACTWSRRASASGSCTPTLARAFDREVPNELRELGLDPSVCCYEIGLRREAAHCREEA